MLCTLNMYFLNEFFTSLKEIVKLELYGDLYIIYIELCYTCMLVCTAQGLGTQNYLHLSDRNLTAELYLSL